MRFLRVPATFLATNWAALLGVLTLVGIVPALAAATRVTSLLDEHADDAFTATLRHVRRTLRRDAPVSGLLLMVVAGIVLNGLLLPRMPAEGRVLLVGALVPMVGALIALLSAYVVVAAEQPGADRTTVVLETVRRVLRRPLAALFAPVLVVLMAPLWLLAPLTIACGMSVPPWLLGRLWGATPES